MLESVDQIITARWIVPVTPGMEVLENHAVVIRGTQIIDLLPGEQAQVTYQATQTLDRSRHVLIPGLVNAHTHSPMVLLRGVADDLPLMEWLEKHIWPIEGDVMGPDFIHDGTELAIAEMLRGGTTCANENYFFPDVLAATFKQFGFRAAVGLPVIQFETPWARTQHEYFERGMAVQSAFSKDDLIDISFVPHAPYTVSNASFERIGDLSAQYGMQVHLHLLETAKEVEDSLKIYGVKPIARLQQLGLINPRLTAIHMTAVNDEEIMLCAENGVSVVHCPESNLKLASGFCPVEKLGQAGVNLGIGSDGCASNNDLDMFGEMRTAALLAKAVAGRADAFGARQALYAATMGGAKAMGLAHKIGSIEPGKQADMAAVELDDIESVPMYDAISQLVYATGRHQVTDAWIAGEQLLSGRQLTRMDSTSIKDKARHWQQRIAKLA